MSERQKPRVQGLSLEERRTRIEARRQGQINERIIKSRWALASFCIISLLVGIALDRTAIYLSSQEVTKIQSIPTPTELIRQEPTVPLSRLTVEDVSRWCNRGSCKVDYDLYPHIRVTNLLVNSCLEVNIPAGRTLRVASIPSDIKPIPEDITGPFIGPACAISYEAK